MFMYTDFIILLEIIKSKYPIINNLNTITIKMNISLGLIRRENEGLNPKKMDESFFKMGQVLKSLKDVPFIIK